MSKETKDNRCGAALLLDSDETSEVSAGFSEQVRDLPDRLTAILVNCGLGPQHIAEWELLTRTLAEKLRTRVFLDHLNQHYDELPPRHYLIVETADHTAQLLGDANEPGSMMRINARPSSTKSVFCSAEWPTMPTTPSSCIVSPISSCREAPTWASTA